MNMQSNPLVDHCAPVRTRWLPLLAAMGVLLILAARQALFVQQYAVDVLYWDSWDLYQPVFDGQGWWATYDQQHGPHRQGLGGMLMRIMAERTRWDCRYDAAAVSGTLIIAAALGLVLAWKCGVRGWALVGVPVIYLNLRQYQMLVALANPSHGAIPMLLLTMFALACFIRKTPLRLSLLVGITFFSIFTGFGLFLGGVTLVLLGLQLTGAFRRKDRLEARRFIVALVGTALVWAAFFAGYQTRHAAMPLLLSLQGIVEYAKFIGFLLANAVGFTNDAIGVPVAAMVTVGLILAGAGLLLCRFLAVRLARTGVDYVPAWAAMFSLALFGVLFTLDAAYGRTPVGWLMAGSPRYVTLCIPTLLALLLMFATSSRLVVRRSAIVWVALLAAGTVMLHPSDLASARWAHDGCLRWRAAYLVTHDIEAANRIAGFSVFPDSSIKDRLQYLQAHQLNLFDETVFGPTDIHPRLPARRSRV